MEVSVVITCWNGKNLLEKNLPKVIKASQNPKNHIKEILVVDDGSIDDSVNFLENNFPQVKVVVHKKNKGYSSVCNTGVNEAKNELVAILNLDVIPNEDFLVEALPLFNDETVFAVSFNEGVFGPGKLTWENGFLGIAPTILPSKTVLTGWASGGSAVFRKAIWNKLGGMDELFLPFYFEDIDLGVRAYKAKYTCLFEPRSKVVHEHESTINPQNIDGKFIDLIKQRNRLLLTWKYIDSKTLLFSHLKGIFNRCLKSPGYLRVVLSSVKRCLFFRRQKVVGDGLSMQEILEINEKIS